MFLEIWIVCHKGHFSPPKYFTSAAMENVYGQVQVKSKAYIFIRGTE